MAFPLVPGVVDFAVVSPVYAMDLERRSRSLRGRGDLVEGGGLRGGDPVFSGALAVGVLRWVTNFGLVGSGSECVIGFHE
jgi:hypothetical protein